MPSPAIPAILEKLDSVHNGKARAMYLSARSYWSPSLKADITAHCDACVPCKKFANKPNAEAHRWLTPPPAIGHTMAADFALVGPRGSKKKFLILVDALSGYAEAIRFVCPPNSASVISKLSGFWQIHGWPLIFASDGEPILTSVEVDKVLEKNGITRRLSSAGNPQSNGLAEKAVQSFKGY